MKKNSAISLALFALFLALMPGALAKPNSDISTYSGCLEWYSYQARQKGRSESVATGTCQCIFTKYHSQKPATVQGLQDINNLCVTENFGIWNAETGSFGSCYMAVSKRASKAWSDIFCGCLDALRSKFDDGDSLGDYCASRTNQIFKAKRDAEAREYVKLMLGSMSNSTTSNSRVKGLDPTCALTRAMGFSCAGDTRIRCSNGQDIFGNQRMYCSEY